MVWLSPSERDGFTGTFQEAKISPGFSLPLAALRIILSNEGVAVSIDRQVQNRCRGSEMIARRKKRHAIMIES